MIDLTLLRCLRERVDYNKYRTNIPLDALEARTKTLIEDIDKYYKAFDDHKGIDFVTFRNLFFGTWHRGMEQEHQDFFDKVLKRMDVEIDQNVKALLTNSLIELKFATDVGNLTALYDGGEDVQIIQQTSQLAEDALAKLGRKEERVYETPDFDKLMEADMDNSGLQWRSNSIAAAIRPLRGGDFVIAAGRPDKGKTSFIADNATFFAKQCSPERPVLWLSNEGVRDSIIRRSIQAALNVSVPEMVQRHKSGTLYNDYFDAIGGRTNLQIEDICGFTNFEVAELIEQVNPSLLIIDMIDKVQFLGMGAQARTDQKLEEMYGWFRELGIKQEFATIAASQISASACDNENSQMWPDDWMLKDSRTGKQGACDLILMIGHSQDPMKDKLRFLSTPKNKLPIAGAPALRAPHVFDADRSRYNEIQS